MLDPRRKHESSIKPRPWYLITSVIVNLEEWRCKKGNWEEPLKARAAWNEAENYIRGVCRISFVQMGGKTRGTCPGQCVPSAAQLLCSLFLKRWPLSSIQSCLFPIHSLDFPLKKWPLIIRIPMFSIWLEIIIRSVVVLHGLGFYVEAEGNWMFSSLKAARA